MKKTSELRPRDWASENIHPGWWFIDVYPNLSPDEKVAWLGLLILAVASYPSGRIAYYSEDELARMLGIEETTFTDVLRRGQGYCLIEVLNKAVKPEILDYSRYDVDPDDLVNPDGFMRFAAIQYKEIVFPGIYSYFPDGTASASDRSIIARGPRTLSEKALLDAEIRGPFDLLQTKIREDLRDELSGLNKSDSPTRPELARCRALPLDTRLVSDERYADAIFSHYPSLALWNKGDLEIFRIIEAAQVELEIWMRDTLSQKDEKGYRLEPRH